MSSSLVQVRELAAWGFDEFPYRPSPVSTVPDDVFRHCAAYTFATAVASSEWDALRAMLHSHAARPDLLRETEGLDWRLDVIDLSALLSFQRRLTLDPRIDRQPTPRQDNAEELIACAFGLPQRPEYETDQIDSRTLCIRTLNPNLQLRLSKQVPFVAVSCGSPFLEVAEFRGRWFLRDGYHRAYDLLCHDVWIVPALVIKARTLKELGATQPRFFEETVLFSDRPPKLVDFLDDRLNITYARPSLTKTLRLTIEESFSPQMGPGDLT